MENIEALGFVKHMAGTVPPEPVGEGEHVTEFRIWAGGTCYALSRRYSFGRGDQPDMWARQFANQVGSVVQWRTYSPTPWQTVPPHFG